MPRKLLALEPGGPKRIELSWGVFWKNFIIYFDREEAGRLDGRHELTQGREFTLKDGSKLRVQLVKKLFAPELQVLRNGTPLPGSGSDPAQKVKIAAGVVYFLGGFNVLLSFIGIMFNVGQLNQMGVGYGTLLMGVLYLLLGFFVMKRSLIALGVTIALLVADSVLTLYVSASAGGRTPFSGLIIRVIFIILLIQGWRAVRELKEAKK